MPLRIKPTRRRFKLRTLLLAVSLVVLVIPLAGVYIFRIYENELVKQTELELIAQAALIAAMYKNEVQEVVRQTHRENGYGIQLNLRASSEVYYRPIKPQLNLSAYVIKARPPEAVQAHVKGDDLALAIGARLTPILLEAQRTTLAGVRLLDFQGIITGGRDDIGKSLAHIPEVQEARAGRYSSAIRERIIHRPAPRSLRSAGVPGFASLSRIRSRQRIVYWALSCCRERPTAFSSTFTAKERKLR
jgi:hypothetical protein